MNLYLSSNNHNDDNNPLNLYRYYKNSHAIVIGIGDYKEEVSLPNAVNDATAVKTVLEEKYDFRKSNILTVLNEEATVDKIRWIFDEKLQDYSMIGAKDRVLIYYSGHGKIRVQFDSDGHEVKTGYIVPFDSKRGSYHRSIMMKDMIRACQTCGAKHILIILDCCYSGYAITRGTELEISRKYVDEYYIQNITKRRAIQILAATQEDEPASDSGIRPGHSAFTGALLDILENEKDPIDNGIITASEIGIVMQYEVKNQEGNIFQIPLYNALSGSQGGDFIFKILKIDKTSDQI